MDTKVAFEETEQYIKDEKFLYVRSVYFPARYITDEYQYFQQAFKQCSYVCYGDVHLIYGAEDNESRIALTHAAGMRSFFKMISSYLMCNRTGNVVEEISRKGDGYAPRLQADDLAEAIGSVKKRKEVADEV